MKTLVVDSRPKYLHEFEGVPFTAEQQSSLDAIRNRINFTADDLIQLFWIITEIRGKDFVYQSKFGSACVNFTVDHTPACIMGSVFYLLGLTYEQCGASGGLSQTIANVHDTRPDLKFTKGFFRFGAMGQALQDNGMNYGHVYEAVATASNTLRDYSVVTGELNKGYWDN